MRNPFSFISSLHRSFTTCLLLTLTGRVFSWRTMISIIATFYLLRGGYLPAATEKVVAKKMGSRFEITAVHSDPAHALEAIDAAYTEIDRIESMISSWKPDSFTSAINRNAGVAPVAVPEELFNLIRRANKVSALTDGAFDITYAGFGKLWNFKAEAPAIPSETTIAEALKSVGYKNLQLDQETHSVFLPKTGMMIGFGAIGKGFAANRAVFILKAYGIVSGVVNAGGDMVLFGQQEDGSLWDVGVAHPRDRDRVFARLRLSEQAVVTSGDYESFMTIEGKRYAHILNPKTGYPVDFLQSVTIICPDGELADALATAVFVMGREKGLALIDRLDRIECMVVDAKGERWYSKQLQTFTYDTN